ncbi:hypothetical protein [Marvinbryantia formatexigens]|nr:hypothetical protein [Marvinbryantia formatexigens]UWO24159.1 hypothetical protein NQ534_17260 [Marvinbryantia formatexigens DSM 14469]SDG70777.1 hypothetical protein SAMN05660368_03113 [Marvinbryantia formatexigens]
MKKFAAILCTAAITLGTVCTAFANPSISYVTIEPQDATVAEESAALIPEGMKLIVAEAEPDNYENEVVAEIVTRLNDPEQMIEMEEILEMLEVDLTEEIKTESGNVIDPLEYEPISEFDDLVLSDDMDVYYDFDGEVKKVKATIEVEALKEVEDIKNNLLMQLDQKEGKVYFIEIEEEDYVPETGEITVTFPCLGPFCVLEKAE